MILDPKVKLKL